MNSKIYIFIKQLGWMTSAHLISAVLRAVTFVIVARNVSSTALGQYAVLVSMLIVLQAIADMGLSKFIVQEHSIGGNNREIKTALKMNELASVLMALFGLMLLLIMAIIVDKNYLVLIPLVCAAAAEKSADTWLGITLAENRGHINAFNLLGRRLISIILFFLLLNWLHDTSTLLILGVAELMAAVFSLIWARINVSSNQKLEISEVRNVLRKAKGFWVNTMAVQLRNLDVPLLSLVAGSSQAGLYSLGNRLIGPLQLLQTNIAKVLLPMASSQLSRKLAWRVNLYTFIPSLLLAYFLFVTADSWVVRLFGSSYINSSDIVALLILTVPWTGLWNLSLTLLQSWRHHSIAALMSVGYNCLFILGIIIGSFNNGAKGAATYALIVSLSGAFFIGAVTFFYSKNQSSTSESGE